MMIENQSLKEKIEYLRPEQLKFIIQALVAGGYVSEACAKQAVAMALDFVKYED